MCVGAQERAWGLTPMKGMNFWYESSSGLLAEKKHRSFRWVGQMSPTTTLGIFPAVPRPEPPLGTQSLCPHLGITAGEGESSI